MSSLTRVLFSTLLLLCLVGVGLGTWEVLQIRQELAALQAKVAQLDRRAPADLPATGPKSVPPPSSPASAAPAASSEVEKLRNEVAELTARVQSLPGAPPPSVSTTPGAQAPRTLPAPTGPTFDPETKDAIKKLAREAMEEGATNAVSVAFAGGPWNTGEVDALTRQLGLSETQKAEIAKIYEQRDKDMAAAWTPTADAKQPLDPKEIEKKMKEIGERTDAQVKQLLTVEQSKKYDEMQSGNNNLIYFGATAKPVAPPEGK